MKAFKEEAQEIVRGIHDPKITQDIFHKVQDILDGKKRVQRKYSSVNEDYQMRGHLFCPRCGKAPNGSSAKGNGGKYFYYHCTSGCKERHMNADVRVILDNVWKKFN